MTGGDQLHVEQRTCVPIDEERRQSGWRVCDAAELNLIHYPASGVREVRMKRSHGQVDYLLYVGRSAVRPCPPPPQEPSIP